MFSVPTIPKLLIAVAIIAVVWYFFRRNRVAKGGGGQDSRSGGSSASQAGGRNAKPIEDMVQCRSCGAYIPANTTCSCKNG